MPGGHILSSWSNTSRAGSSGAGLPWPAAPPACRGQDWVTLFHIIGVESEDRTKDGPTLQDRACAPVKVAVSCGHGTDAQSVHGEALC